MNKFIQVIAASVTGIFLFFGLAHAADMGSVSITSPKNGSTVMAGSMVKLTYNVKLGPDGNHLHIYVDDQKPMIVREVTGCPCSVELPALSKGQHTIVVKEARADHSLTGLQASTMVTVK